MAVIIMMEDDYYDPHAKPETKTSPGRWVVFAILVITGVVGVGGLLLMAPPELSIFYVIFFVPMLVFMLYAAFRWAQGRPIVTTNLAEDDKILTPMRHHALPAQQVGGLEMYRCPDCGMSFELVNATPVEENVVLCPICGTRLFIG